MTRAGKIRWAWFVVFVLLYRLLFIYLLYCLFTEKRVCEICHCRIPYYPTEKDWRLDYEHKRQL